MAAAFSIREDLQHRDLDEQVEILFISGPHAGELNWIAKRLGMDESDVHAAVLRLAEKPGKRYDTIRRRFA